MRTLVLGAKGQLGRDLVLRFAQDGEATGLAHAELDITDPAAVRDAIASTHADCVLNAAAYTDVEGAESNRDMAFRVNETGARTVAQACDEADLPLVHYSTDFVFAGDATAPYEPDSPLDPRGVYAESKAAGELAVRNACPNHYLIRTAWVYGLGGNNFVEKILAAAAKNPKLRVVTDESGSPTYTADIADATAALCRTGAFGTYHCVNAGSCSRFEYAAAILKLAGVDIPIEPCLAAEYPSKAPRPKYSVLSNAKLEQATGHRMPDWQDALGRYLQRRKETK